MYYQERDKNMNDTDMLKYNKYIFLFNTVYDILSKGLHEDDKESSGKKSLFKKEDSSTKSRYLDKDISYKNPNTMKAIKEINKFFDEECGMDSILGFSSLWQFAQFVKYAEKTIFYPNKSNNSLYVSTDMNEVKNRIIILNTDAKIKLKLEKANDPINDKIYNIINLSIERDLDDKTKNIFTIVDADVKLEDCSDLYLINSVNHDLYNCVINTFMEIFKKLIIRQNIGVEYYDF